MAYYNAKWYTRTRFSSFDVVRRMGYLRLPFNCSILFMFRYKKHLFHHSHHVHALTIICDWKTAVSSSVKCTGFFFIVVASAFVSVWIGRWKTFALQNDNNERWKVMKEINVLSKQTNITAKMEKCGAVKEFCHAKKINCSRNICFYAQRDLFI